MFFIVWTRKGTHSDRLLGIIFIAGMKDESSFPEKRIAIVIAYMQINMQSATYVSL